MSEAQAVERLVSWPDSRLKLTPAAAWLIDHGGEAMTMQALIGGLCEKLLEEGLPLQRVNVALPSMHPQVYARAFTWVRGEGVSTVATNHDVRQSKEYFNSPVYAIHQGAAAIRRRLDLPNAPMDYGILPELKEKGVTDYLVLPMRFTQGPVSGVNDQGVQRHVSFASFTTDRPGGFQPSELSYLMELTPIMALRLEIEAARRMTRDLLITYLGRAPAKRVLKGNFIRGRSFEVEAAIWVCDLRGFTSISDRTAPAELIGMLDDYFEAMARPVQQREGEVLKFIGDGMLAIFRAGDGNLQPGEDPRQAACRRALEAAKAAFEGLHELNQGRGIGGAPPLKAGIGLHYGRVLFGNVGATDRLDFTVIGRAVNEVARVEAATKIMGRPLLASGAFAEILGAGQQSVGQQKTECKLESLGFHVLRGVQEPRELFALPLKEIPGYT